MLYLVALLFPPIAVMMCGKWVQGLLLNPLLCLFFWLPGVIHALLVVSNYYSDKRTDKLIEAIGR